MLLPSKSLPQNYTLEFEIDGTVFLSQTIQIKTQTEDENSSDRLVSFSISIVLHSHAGKHITKEYKNMIKQLSAALNHSEELDNYLSKEAKKILSVREKWIQKQLDSYYKKQSGGNSASPNQSSIKPPNHVKLNEDILKASTLAVELKSLFHSLLDSASASVKFNGWIHFSYIIQKNPASFPSSLPSLRPYHALLLLPSNPNTTGL